jgi:hypothetical protein
LFCFNFNKSFHINFSQFPAHISSKVTPPFVSRAKETRKIVVKNWSSKICENSLVKIVRAALNERIRKSINHLIIHSRTNGKQQVENASFCVHHFFRFILFLAKVGQMQSGKGFASLSLSFISFCLPVFMVFLHEKTISSLDGKLL